MSTRPGTCSSPAANDMNLSQAGASSQQETRVTRRVPLLSSSVYMRVAPAFRTAREQRYTRRLMRGVAQVPKGQLWVFCRPFGAWVLGRLRSRGCAPGYQPRLLRSRNMQSPPGLSLTARPPLSGAHAGMPVVVCSPVFSADAGAPPAARLPVSRADAMSKIGL